MARLLLAVVIPAVLLAAVQAQQQEQTAVDVARQVYAECLQRGSVACVRPRVLAFLAEAKQRADKAIRITRDLSVIPCADGNSLDADNQDGLLEEAPSSLRGDALRQMVLERLDAVERFLQSHEVRVAVPRELAEAVPSVVKNALPDELRLPLDPEREDGARHRRKRGFLKKVVLPFILGLKFKSTVLIPMALSLIALKTWKALTLGLLSLVLSAAMVIFRFTKPKEIINYDVYHVDHVQERDGRDLAYRGRRR
ncbi:uncharacterized protein LOC113204933 isoform X2 [Frankliniella occidentalis]|uniref:Uncharacterized protein LOC113204933 isoform X2 n=1 Tax=Frankliniella occidentalis TaxID=133901 RepID=A0A6J1SBN6_FRAOC|nr:uncharacterized protein LOC113204933 isoform X2 [Frankliniella occidentalis]